MHYKNKISNFTHYENWILVEPCLKLYVFLKQKYNINIVYNMIREIFKKFLLCFQFILYAYIWDPKMFYGDIFSLTICK